jgi:hypothetical protein
MGIETLRAPRDEQDVIALKLEQRRAHVDAKLTDWAGQQRFTDWQAAAPRDATSNMGAEFAVEPDQSIRVSGPTAKGKYVVMLESSLPQITGVMLEALPDEKLPSGGPGRAADGNFVLSEVRVTVAPRNDPLATQAVVLRNPASSFNQDGFPVQNAIDGNLETGWAISPRKAERLVASFEFRGQVGYEGGTRLFVELDQQHGGGDYTLGRFRLSVTGSSAPVSWQQPDLPVDVAAILRLPADQRSPRQQAIIRDFHRTLDSEYTSLEHAVDLVSNQRLVGLQDLAWALINTPAFLFNH